MNNEPFPPPTNSEPQDGVSAVFGTKPISPPSIKQQSWGAVISILIIMLMIIIGAFYAWGKRAAQEHALTATTTAATTPQTQ